MIFSVHTGCKHIHMICLKYFISVCNLQLIPVSKGSRTVYRDVMGKRIPVVGVYVASSDGGKVASLPSAHLTVP